MIILFNIQKTAFCFVSVFLALGMSSPMTKSWLRRWQSSLVQKKNGQMLPNAFGIIILTGRFNGHLEPVSRSIQRFFLVCSLWQDEIPPYFTDTSMLRTVHFVQERPVLLIIIIKYYMDVICAILLRDSLWIDHVLTYATAFLKTWYWNQTWH